MKTIISSALNLLTIAAVVAGLLPGLRRPANAQSAVKKGPHFHTRSIVACDPATGECGIAVVSFPTGTSAVVPVGEAGVMVANQAFPSYATARAIIGKIKGGADAPTALAKALAADPGQDFRQFGVAALSQTTPSGVTVAGFTGAATDPAICSTTGPTYVVQANTQSSSAVCSAMAAGFEAATGSLPRRLLAALKAGTAAGGDARGEFSASIRVFSDAWLLSEVTPITADATVGRAADWETELEYNLNAYLAMITPGNPSDQVELTGGRAKQVLKVLRDLKYYRGSVDGKWSSEAEAALQAFADFGNLFFPKPTVVDGGTRYIDGPLADYMVTGAVRNVLTPNPEK